MRFLLIPDKFKGSLDALGVIRAVSEGILRVYPDTEIHSVLASDGGDGFLNAVSENLDVESVRMETVDPLGRDIAADYLFNGATKTAYIELAKASGLELLKDAERDVMNTSTYGTGLQIRHSIERGATRIYLGLGGSATNDAGTGIAKAMGYRFLDVSGKELVPTGGNLSQITTIEKSGRFKDRSRDWPKDGSKDWGNVRFFAVNDVDNPLFGERGAAYVYAEQKGANAEEVRTLDTGLRHLNQVILTGPNTFTVSGNKVLLDIVNPNNAEKNPLDGISDHNIVSNSVQKASTDSSIQDIVDSTISGANSLLENAANMPGAGAAGGTAYGLHVFLGAEFVSGIAFVLELSQVHRLLSEQQFDYIITGEGKFDQQTLYGKLIKGVRDVGNRHKVPVIVICGQLDVTPKKLKDFGLESILEIRDTSKSVQYSMENAAQLISKTIAAYLEGNRH